MCIVVLQTKRNTKDDYDLANDANAKVSSDCRTNVTNTKKARDHDYEMSRMQGLLNGVCANLFRISLFSLYVIVLCGILVSSTSKIKTNSKINNQK